MDRNLNFRPGKSGEDEQHAQTRLHCRLSLRLRKLNRTPEPGDAFGFRVLSDVRMQLVHGDQAGV
jgi:hypothetical protein